ncbi:nucleotide pyrophosphohydrolase [Candidatus Marsarchaeota archaeon]|nr:nucleotide pyrophosphohydrolase [Candidatus Marsarchaeota archaeon]
MDSDTTIKSLKDKVAKFRDDRDWKQYHNAKDLAIGISTESSELLDIFRFKSLDEVDKMFHDRKKLTEIRDELADVCIMALALSQRYDIDLSKSITAKLKKSAIKYPILKSRGSNKKYTEL